MKGKVTQWKDDKGFGFKERIGVISGPPRDARKSYWVAKRVLLPYTRPWGEVAKHLWP